MLSELVVKGVKVKTIKVGSDNYISITDLAKYNNKNRVDYVIQNWMRTTNTILFLGTWEYLHNINFNSIEFDGFKNDSGVNSFVMTPKKWISKTNAIGIISKSGRYNSGTYVHPDIAFEFASWISPEFKLYLIKEFERLKKEELNKNNVEWKATRILSKINYAIHIDAINKNIIPKLTDEQIKYVYSDEADILNVALFGITASEWKKQNKELSKNGNIRDYADLIQLIILNNLQSINSELVSQNISQSERIVRLNNSARMQMNILKNNKNISDLKLLEKNYNDNTLN